MTRIVAPPAPAVEDENLGALFHRLIDDGKRYVHAEVAIRTTTVRTKASRSGLGVALLVVALLLVIAGVVVLVVALGALLASWLGAAGGFAVAAVIALALAALLAKIGIGRITTALKAPVT